MIDAFVRKQFVWVTETADRWIGWDRLPQPFSLVVLSGLRMVLRRENLVDVQGATTAPGPSPHGPDDRPLTRTADGTDNDMSARQMGSVGTHFGRNVPIADTEPRDVLTPSPRTVSRELMTRREFQPAASLNVLAAAWLQFEVHDWFSHGRNDTETWTIPLDEDDPWPEHPMRIPRTHRDEPTLDGGPPTYRNTETHWWDASQVYGSNLDIQKKLRTFEDGKLALTQEGLVPFDPTAMRELAGVNGNWWVGLAMLHTVFMREHNSICDNLAGAYPNWTDDELFEHARLVNAALLAKIHTVEWTTALLGHPALQTGMRANWWGVLGERFARRFGRISSSEELSGIPGSETDHHGIPYAMTEEFVAVYRMHPLIPDDYAIRSVADDRILEQLAFPEVAGANTRGLIETVEMADLLYSFGRSHPGAIVLNNFPKHLQHFVRFDGEILDLAATDILRNRERGVPRYNDFRRRFRLAPATTFEDFSDDPAVVADLRRVYDDPEDVDLMVGLYAERPPKGFAFSDTAFRVFILMASRRLKSDRFFTYDYRPEVYTQEGMDWIADNTMATVLLRHFPELSDALNGVKNAFAPWRAVTPA